MNPGSQRAFQHMSAIIHAQKVAYGKDRQADYRYTGNALGATFGNLMTTANGIARTLTNQQAATMAHIHQIGGKVAYQNAKTINAAHSASGNVGGLVDNASLMSARGLQHASQTASRGMMSGGRLQGLAGAAALNVGKQTVTAEKAAGQFELNQALAYRTQQDTATIAQEQMQLQQQKLQEQLQEQQMQMQARLDRRNSAFAARLQETLQERQMKIQQGYTMQNMAAQQGFDMTNAAFQAAMQANAAASAKTDAQMQTARDQFAQDAASGQMTRGQALDLLNYYTSAYDLSPTQVAELNSTVDSLWTNQGANSYANVSVGPLPEDLQTKIWNTVDAGIKNGDGWNTIVQAIPGLGPAKGMTPAFTAAMEDMGHRIYDRLSAAQPQSSGNWLQDLGFAAAGAAVVGGTVAGGTNWIINKTHPQFNASTQAGTAKGVSSYASNLPEEIARPSGGAMGRSSNPDLGAQSEVAAPVATAPEIATHIPAQLPAGEQYSALPAEATPGYKGRFTEPPPQAVERGWDKLSSDMAQRAQAARDAMPNVQMGEGQPLENTIPGGGGGVAEVFGGAGAATAGDAVGLPLFGVGAGGGKVPVPAAMVPGLLPQDHTSPQDSAQFSTALQTVANASPSQQQQTLDALSHDPSTNWMVYPILRVLSGALQDDPNMQGIVADPANGGFFTRTTG